MARREDPDPRIVRTRQIVLAAVLEELAEVGHSRFTIESVADRCGVGKSTIYRHWDGKSHLIIDAMQTLNSQPEPGADGSPRDRIRQLMGHLADALTSSTVGAALPALIEAAERNDQLRDAFHAYSSDRRRALTEAITEAVAAGYVPPHVQPDLAAQALAGAVFYTRLMTPSTLDDAAIEQLIVSVLGPAPGTELGDRRIGGRRDRDDGPART